jgi:hypothetical protein
LLPRTPVGISVVFSLKKPESAPRLGSVQTNVLQSPLRFPSRADSQCVTCRFLVCTVSLTAVTKRDRICSGRLSKNHSVALVRERTIPTERPQLVGEVTANFWE